MSDLELSSVVVDQLRRYYLEEERVARLTGCLEAAQKITRLEDLSSTPFIAQAVAHLLREALGEISRAASDPSEGKWSILSNDVVDAETRVEAAPPNQRESAVHELYAAIDELRAFQDSQPRKHERGLVNLVADSTGATVVGGTARKYGRVVSDLSSIAHGSQSLEDVAAVHRTAIELLELLFAPPEPRVERLDELARLDDPTDDDVAELTGLITNDLELRRFLSSVQTSTWLWKIGWEDVLRPGRSVWAVIKLAERLAHAEARSIAGWLKRAFFAWGADQQCAEAIASAARVVGEDGHGVLLKTLEAFPGSRWIQHDVGIAAEEADANSRFVEEAFGALRRANDG